MRYVECPEIYPLLDNKRGLFLAGGITGCPDWQSEIVVLLGDTDWVVFNPRRKNFPIDDPDVATEQIKWEYDHLRKASTILFWFPYQAICPIALYELGAWSMTEKPMYIGMHPEYERRKDVEVQTGLVRPDVVIVYTLEDLVTLVKA
jgi:hypothetical protein